MQRRTFLTGAAGLVTGAGLGFGPATFAGAQAPEKTKVVLGVGG